MCPYPVFLGLTLYDLLLCAGVALCFVLFSRLADKVGVKRNVQSFTLFVGIFAVTLGYCSAVLLLLLECLCVGFFEECAFRGVVFLGILKKKPQSKLWAFISIALSSVVFGLVHL